MNVMLLNCMPNPMQTIAAAALLCYSKNSLRDAWDTAASYAKQMSIIEHCVTSGHHSVLEHVSLTFGIEGISRACSHQLVRHRLCVFSQQSQRYVGMDDFEIVVPPTFVEMAEEHSRWGDLGPEGQLFGIKHKAVEAYRRIVRSFELHDGTKGETANQDARYVLPNACKTNLIWTANFRELMHVCSVRLCKRSQWEIRNMMHEVVDCIRGNADYSFLATLLEPKCAPLGYCPEDRSCGDMPKRDAVISAAEGVGLYADKANKGR